MWPQPAPGPPRSGAPEILFPFDDGPHERTTPRILAALRAHGIHAIFFTVGWRISGDDPGDTARRAVLRQVLAEGHVLGNHTWNHAHLCMGRRQEAEREIDATGALLTALQGSEVVFFRAPYGSRCRRLEQMLAERGLAHLHWDMDAREYLEHDGATTRGPSRASGRCCSCTTRSRPRRAPCPRSSTGSGARTSAGASAASSRSGGSRGWTSRASAL